jgi:hypothetical protein
VDTKIGDAERNRPADMANATNPGGAGLQLGDVLKRGKSPADVAELVFQSIIEERFYILPHAGWDEAVLGRVEAVLARGEPHHVDMGALARKRTQGMDV